MAIIIKTRLHEGIYRSQGGGETRTVSEYTTGPRNLLTALDALHTERQENRAGYGSIGCGRSWMEIDGTPVDSDFLADLDASLVADEFEHWRKSGLSWLKPKTRTERARELIELVRAGKLASMTADVAEWRASQS